MPRPPHHLVFHCPRRHPTRSCKILCPSRRIVQRTANKVNFHILISTSNSQTANGWSVIVLEIVLFSEQLSLMPAWFECFFWKGSSFSLEMELPKDSTAVYDMVEHNNPGICRFTKKFTD